MCGTSSRSGLLKLWKSKFNNSSVMKNGVVLLSVLLSVREPSVLFSIKSENLKLASRSRDYMRKSTIENLKTCQPREQNLQLSFDKRCSFPAQNSAFSLGQTGWCLGNCHVWKVNIREKIVTLQGCNWTKMVVTFLISLRLIEISSLPFSYHFVHAALHLLNEYYIS